MPYHNLVFYNFIYHITFIQLPGRKGTGISGWVIQAKLRVYFWLGLTKLKKNFVVGLPAGHEVSQEIKSAERPRALPPSVIHFTEKHVRLLTK